jgi:hypothetical protein
VTAVLEEQSRAASERRVIAQFIGADPGTVPSELRSILEAAMLNAPRSLQERIGPSELGIECGRCLAHKLAGTPERPEAAWLPQIGTAVHEWAETVMLRHEHVRGTLGMPGRFLPECRVTVGVVGGVEISGSTDVFDTHTGTVVDWKVVGTTTLKAAKAHGASLQYQRQAHLYGKGWEDAGYQVRSVLIYFLPRNAMTLADAYPWQTNYDRQNALATLLRANEIALAIHDHGLDKVLAGIPEHDFTGFSCKKFATPTTNNDAPFGAL